MGGFMWRIILSAIFLTVSLAVLPRLFAQNETRIFSYSQFSTSAELWQRGFVYGIAESLSTFAANEKDAAFPQGYRRCLGGKMSDQSLVHAVRNYVQKSPDAWVEAATVVIAKALYEICKPYIDSVR